MCISVVDVVPSIHQTVSSLWFHLEENIYDFRSLFLVNYFGEAVASPASSQAAPPPKTAQTETHRTPNKFLATIDKHLQCF